MMRRVRFPLNSRENHIFIMSAFQSQIHLPDLLEHDLNQYFPYLLQFESLENAKQSEVYKKIKPTVDQILSAVVCENFATSSLSLIHI